MSIERMISEAQNRVAAAENHIGTEVLLGEASFDYAYAFQEGFPDAVVDQVQGSTDSRLDPSGDLQTCGEAIAVDGVLFVHGIDFDRSPAARLRGLIWQNISILGPVVKRQRVEDRRWWQPDEYEIVRAEPIHYSVRTKDKTELFGKFYRPSLSVPEDLSPYTGETHYLGLERPLPPITDPEYRRLLEEAAQHPMARDRNKASWWHILYTPGEKVGAETPLFRPVSDSVPTAEMAVQAFSTIFTHFKNARLESVMDALLSDEVLELAALAKIEQEFLAAITKQEEPDSSQSGYSFGVGTAGGSSAPSP